MEEDKPISGMAERISECLKERRWSQANLAAKVSEIAVTLGLAPLSPKTLSATLKRKGGNSQWSDLIAEALEVNHRWLQCGVGPKDRAPSPWRFGKLSYEKVQALSAADFDRLEAGILGVAQGLDLDVVNDESENGRSRANLSVSSRAGHAAARR